MAWWWSSSERRRGSHLGTCTRAPNCSVLSGAGMYLNFTASTIMSSSPTMRIGSRLSLVMNTGACLARRSARPDQAAYALIASGAGIEPIERLAIGRDIARQRVLAPLEDSRMGDPGADRLVLDLGNVAPLGHEADALVLHRIEQERRLGEADIDLFGHDLGEGRCVVSGGGRHETDPEM